MFQRFYSLERDKLLNISKFLHLIDSSFEKNINFELFLIFSNFNSAGFIRINYNYYEKLISLLEFYHL